MEDGIRAQAEGHALDKSRDGWSFIKEGRQHMSRDESRLIDLGEKHTFFLWQLLFINETRIWSEEQGDVGDFREREKS